MHRSLTRMAAGLLLVCLALSVGQVTLPRSGAARSSAGGMPAECATLAFSTEEDFIARGGEYISDGDLLGPNCVICARNRDLVGRFDVSADLGLDAVDVIDAPGFLIAFSTELNSPNVGQFTAGDLLATNGAIIPNRALVIRFQVPYDIGLDALQFIGDPRSISAFLDAAQKLGRAAFEQNPGALSSLLREYKIDLWFSTEGSWIIPGGLNFADGDVLSARDGIVVLSNAALLPASVPAGIPSRGVDFGLDALATDRAGNRTSLQFSTEILYQGGQPSFTDGDILRFGDGVLTPNEELVRCFEPKAPFLGLDALSIADTRPSVNTYLQLLFKLFRGK